MDNHIDRLAGIGCVRVIQPLTYAIERLALHALAETLCDVAFVSRRAGVSALDVEQIGDADKVCILFCL
ncbi:MULTISPECIES: hypothetical protein [Paraburkholderia]|uniref:Uncharacterized protein n=1 Tax=Paraburkholderia guartelaensis TaxID=2546446 RepID=A0ABU9SLY7_9BURK|nr:hypothetical protein [Paraburkholderia nodosa]